MLFFVSHLIVGPFIFARLHQSTHPPAERPLAVFMCSERSFSRIARLVAQR